MINRRGRRSAVKSRRVRGEALRASDAVKGGHQSLAVVMDWAAANYIVLRYFSSRGQLGEAWARYVVRMIALGAEGVLLGRAYLYALAAQGSAGVARLLDLFANEIRVAMTLTGVRSIGEITRANLA